MLIVRSLTAWQRYLLSAAIIATITLALIQIVPDARQPNVAVIYLLAVLICATLLGLGPGLLSSALAFLAFNFFFVVPLHTFVVENPQDLIELLTFFGVAIIASGLAGRARDQVETSERRSAELAALYDLSQTISAEVDLDRVLPAIARTTAQLLDVPACGILLYDDGGRLVERASYGAGPRESLRRSDVFLKVGPRVLGVLRVTHRSLNEALTDGEQKLLDTIAGQLTSLLERARLFEEVSRTRALAESDRLKSALLSSVSHDLRTPLAVIKGSVTNLLDESVAWDPAMRRDLLSAVNDEADRLNRLVGNLLEMSRIESGALQSTRGWQDLGELIAAVVDRLRLRLADRAVTLDVPPDLPLARINYTQIDQVLTNLLENVIKHTPAGTPVTVAARAGLSAIEVEVRDAGPGIPPAMMSQIFDKFMRGSGPEQHADGSGLGLAICKGIVEAHAGQIWAENLPQGGARFVFTLPLAPAPSPAATRSDDDAV